MNTKPLTPREQQLATILATGIKTKEAAVQAGHSLNYTYRLIESIKIKYRVATLKELVKALQEEYGNTTPE